MALEPINGAIQSAVTMADGVRVVNTQHGDETARSAPVPNELPTKAVKEIPAAQEEEQLKEAADQLNEFVKNFASNLEFFVDKDTGKMVVKVLEKQTGKLIRQIPSEEMLQIAKVLDTVQGLIIRKNA